MKKNVLIIGSGGVAHVTAHKCAQNNDILGDICIASRNTEKCNKIIESIYRKGSMKDKSGLIFAERIDAFNTGELVTLIKDTESEIVINLGTAFINMSVLEACIKAGVDYIDTAIHEEPDRVATICEPPPWYGNYEWKRKDRCTKAKINAILGIGFDPGLVNAYAAYAAKHIFDSISSIDILDVNAGKHDRYFATNFDPEINFREFTGKVWEWENKKWTEYKTHEVKRFYDFPIVGKLPIYLTGHDEIHSLSKNMKVDNIRFWMGFGDHYINVFNVLNKIGLLSSDPVELLNGEAVIPLHVVKACLPDPKELAPSYKGKTCIGNLIKGIKNGKETSAFIYNICDHEVCYNEVEAQAISYTAGVPACAAAILLAKGIWNPQTMVNVEELDPDDLIELNGEMGLETLISTTEVKELTKE